MKSCQGSWQFPLSPSLPPSLIGGLLHSVTTFWKADKHMFLFFPSLKNFTLIFRDNADRCVKEFKKQQKKGAGRLKMPKVLIFIIVSRSLSLSQNYSSQIENFFFFLFTFFKLVLSTWDTLIILDEGLSYWWHCVYVGHVLSTWITICFFPLIVPKNYI